MKELDIRGIGMTSQRARDRLTSELERKGIQHAGLLDVLRKIPRHLFMDTALATRAYEDSALPIGHGQTISQPYTVARMTELLLADSTPNNVLEVGTGSGYQAAILGAFVKELHTVEIIEPLYRRSRDLLYQLGYRNIRCHKGDGNWGWQQSAPYDAIMVTAAPSHTPQELLDQLATGGKMIIPVGQQNRSQKLTVYTKTTDDSYQKKEYDDVQFVPFV